MLPLIEQYIFNKTTLWDGHDFCSFELILSDQSVTSDVLNKHPILTFATEIMDIVLEGSVGRVEFER